MSAATRLSLSQIRDVFRLLGDLRDLRHDPTARKQRMLTGLCELLGARQGSAIGMSGFTPTGIVKVHDLEHGGWASPAAAAIWENVLRHGNPRDDVLLDRATRTTETAIAVLRPQLISDEEFYAAPLAREIIRMTEIDSHVCGWIRRPDDPAQVIALTFHRHWHSRPFTLRQRNLLQLFLEELRELDRREIFSTDSSPLVVPQLSRRESDVLRRFLQGDSVKEAANALALSRRTVEDYVKSLYTKFAVHSRAELLAKWVRDHPKT